MLQIEYSLVNSHQSLSASNFIILSNVSVSRDLRVQVGDLNSGGEGLQIADFSPSIWGMSGNTDRNSLNWLFGVSCIVFTLSSCVSWGSDSVSREVIEVRSSM